MRSTTLRSSSIKSTRVVSAMVVRSFRLWHHDDLRHPVGLLASSTRRLHRQPDEEGGADLDGFKRERATVRFDDAAGDRESETRSGTTATAASVGAEQSLGVVERDAASEIDDAYFHCFG